MTKAELFKQAIERLESDNRYFSSDKEAEYMSDMANWCMVHATKYMPIKKPDGTMYIPSTAMATGFKFPRTTIHTTINHVVKSHGYGSWDDTPIVILAPYNSIVAKNNNPTQISAVDTFWSVNPDVGLVLPESAYIIQPDDNGPLYEIGEHGATYKRDNYTEEEVNTIVSMLVPEQRMEYERFANGDLQQWEIEDELRGQDKRVRQMYENASDKKAFLRGLFEESRFNMLSKYLRDAVVRLSMDKMGFKQTYDHSDGSKLNTTIENIAKSHGIEGKSSDKGHNDSVYYGMEDTCATINAVFYGAWHDGGLFNAQNMAEVYDFIDGEKSSKYMQPFMHNIVDNKPIDFYAFYEDEYERFFAENYPNKKTIADYDKNLAETIRRNCEKLSAEYNAWREKLCRQPGYGTLVQKLRALIPAQNIIRVGREKD